MARQMKDSGIEWIGEIAEDHPLIKLKHVCQILDQYRSPVTADQRSQTGEVLYDYYGASGAIDKIDGYTIDDHVMLIGEDGANLRLRNLPLMYEVNGKAWINNHAHILKPNDGTDFYYLFYALEAQDINPYITGSAQPKLSQENLKNILIPMPSLAVQRKITVVIREKSAEIDAVIERTKATIEEYKKLKQAVITEAVTKGVRGPRKMQDSGIEWIGEIPEGWEVVKATRLIVSTQNGLTRRDLDKSNGQIVLKLKNITAFGQLDYTEINRIQLTEKELETYQLSDGDFLFVRVNGSKNLVGKCAIYQDISEPVAYNDHIIRVRLNEWCNKLYFQWFLLSDSGKVEIDLHTSTAAGQYTISGEGLRDLHIVIPPQVEQDEIVSFLTVHTAHIDTLIAKKTALLTELETYKKSLIYEYVTGKKEVM